MSPGRTMRLLFAAVLTLAAVLPAQAQPRAGVAVTGSVTDESGAALPGANVQLTGSGLNRFHTTGSDGKYTFPGVPTGAYKLSVTLTGFNPVTQSVTVAETATAIPVITLRIAQRTEQLVVTATRSEAELVNAPATVSVIGSDTIQASPAQNYGDLLRSVPGLNVIQMSNRDINLTSRQGTSTLSNSQLALLDGRSIYLDFFGLILWDFVPSNPADIKQIEVVRGPASAVWGANALTGVVNIITKTPRESQGLNVTLTGGVIDRKCDRCSQTDTGTSYGGSFSYAKAVNDRWSYKLTAGYFNSDPYSRPTGQIPRITDPRDPTKKVGGALYPTDSDAGAFGTHFGNSKTSQPKVDLRVDQEFGNGARVSYSGGYAGSEGIVHTGIGPFDIQSGSYMAYGRASYAQRALKVSAFANFVNADAPNLLAFDPVTQKPVQLNFTTQTFDFEVGNSNLIGGHNIFSYGGNARRNNFDITIAPQSKDRNEFGAYVQDEILYDRFRLTLGGRVDKFGNLDKAVFSPRISAMYKPAPSHALRVSYNRAFRSPSTINNYLNQAIVEPVDLSGLAPLLQGLGLGALAPALRAPFPLVVVATGNENLKEESLDAYEIGYTGTFAGRTTVGAAYYINDQDNNINFSNLAPNVDPYTAANPPPGWTARGLPPQLLAVLANLPAQFGGPIFLPRTAFTYLNLGPIRNKGVELSVDHTINKEWSAFVNYSWQGKTEVKKVDAGKTPFPAGELAFAPKNRFNAGINVNAHRYLGNVTVNYADKAFWSDVLTAEYAGYTDAFTMVNGTLGLKWAEGKYVTSVKVVNLLNEDVQQHVFGDILKRSISAELRMKF